jgi:autotransporter-associated beta strand protein
LNWIGVDEFNNAVDEDSGSGGFAAIGADVTIDLNGQNPTVIEWESRAFLESGHALLFGSRSADHAVIWTDSLNLSQSGFANYNAREIHVTDNPTSPGDRARFNAPIGGSVQNDLLKTGAGVLEFTVSNSYLGATIVHEGTLLVNGSGSIATSFLTDVQNGGTLGGNGTIGALRVRPGGRLSPGANTSTPGALATGDVTLTGPGAQFLVELAGATAGALYDQIITSGSISLNGADLAGSLINGFTPMPNDLFFIIVNDGSDPVSGTFAQGSQITISGSPFEIFYTGDSATNSASGGNDVVVRFVPEPATGSLVFGAGLLAFAARRRR